jgi:hypothetical protein
LLRTLLMSYGPVYGLRMFRGTSEARSSLCLAIAAACLFLVHAATAFGARQAPVIESASSTSLGETSVALDARIDPDGLATTYQFWLECEIPSTTMTFCEPGATSVLLHAGSLAALGEGQDVSYELTGLHAGYTYVYRVVASNSSGTVEDPYNVAQTSPPGACAKCANETPAYVPEVSQWSIEANNKEGERATAEYQEKLTRERKAIEEAQAAKARVEQEASEREAAEQTEQLRTREARICVVPRLHGDSLPKARRALRRAHCELGRTTLSRNHGRRLVVVRQGPAPGRRFPLNTRVAVTLGAPASPPR